jgi:hypothetical protein
MTEIQKNKWAVPALVLGIVSAFLAFLIVPPILAIVFGSLGISRSSDLQNEGVKKTGSGMSMAGLILGIVYIGIGFWNWQ